MKEDVHGGDLAQLPPVVSGDSSTAEVKGASGGDHAVSEGVDDSESDSVEEDVGGADNHEHTTEADNAITTSVAPDAQDVENEKQVFSLDQPGGSLVDKEDLVEDKFAAGATTVERGTKSRNHSYCT